MKLRLLLAVILVLLILPAAAAQDRGHLTYGIGGEYEPKIDHTLVQLIDARAKLIKRYAGTLAWGVSVMGDEAPLSGDQISWLCVYVYKDSVTAFAVDFDKFATRNPGGTLGVDGITVVVEVIE